MAISLHQIGYEVQLTMFKLVRFSRSRPILALQACIGVVLMLLFAGAAARESLSQVREPIKDKLKYGEPERVRRYDWDRRLERLEDAQAGFVAMDKQVSILESELARVALIQKEVEARREKELEELKDEAKTNRYLLWAMSLLAGERAWAMFSRAFRGWTPRSPAPEPDNKEHS